MLGADLLKETGRGVARYHQAILGTSRLSFSRRLERYYSIHMFDSLILQINKPMRIGITADHDDLCAFVDRSAAEQFISCRGSRESSRS